jgi:glycosyltransferase involved in cell wall biosynthesis
MASIQFSIIIPTFNRSAVLRDCLANIGFQHFDLDRIEVIVVDDGSTDDTERMVGSLGLPFAITYCRQQNRGPAAARNLAISRARGEWLLFINDDTLLARNALERHLHGHLSRPGEAVAVLGRFDPIPEFAQTPIGYVIAHMDLVFQYRNLKHDGYHKFVYFYTCNISVRRELVIRAGLFDEDFRQPAGEDIELGARLEALGCRVVFDAYCNAYHDHVLCAAQFAAMHRMRGAAAMTFFHKHPKRCWLYEHQRARLRNVARERELAEVTERTVMTPLIGSIDALNTEYRDAGREQVNTVAAHIAPLMSNLKSFYEWWGYLDNPLCPEVLAGGAAKHPVPAVLPSGAAVRSA